MNCQFGRLLELVIRVSRETQYVVDFEIFGLSQRVWLDVYDNDKHLIEAFLSLNNPTLADEVNNWISVLEPLLETKQ